MRSRVFPCEQFLAEHSWGQASQRVMGSFLVIALQPLVCDLSHFIKRGEQPAVEYLGPAGPIEALDESILIRFARLDKAQFDALIFAPLGKML